MAAQMAVTILTFASWGHRPGEHLRLCPQDYTCCSSQMEETLALQSERDFLKAVEDNSQFLLTTFTQRHRRFDGERLSHSLIGNISRCEFW